MRAKDIMTTHVVTVLPDTEVSSLASLFIHKGVDAVPVVQPDGRVIGMISDADLTARVAGWRSEDHSSWSLCLQSPRQLAANIRKIVGQKASDIMTSPAVTIHDEMTVRDIAELFAVHHLRRVPVVKNGKLAGIVSRADLVRILAVANAAETAASVTDHDIRQNVLNGVQAHSPSRNHQVSAVVFDGVVHLWGVVDTAEVREAKQLIAERIAGVRRVHNHIAVLDFTPHDIATVV